MVGGAVLAGGASSRMGRDKALLLLGGVPMALRVAQAMQAAGCTPVCLVGRQPALRDLGLPVLQEPDRAERHPLFGVALALQQATTDLILVSPCDLPALTADALSLLLVAGQPCVATDQPLLCLLPRAWAAQALALAKQGRPAHHLTGQLPKVDLPPHVLHNVNAPQDLSGAELEA